MLSPPPSPSNGPDHAIARQPVGDLLASLASKTPAPGGGAAAGLLGATGAGLAGMVVAYSIGKKAHEPDRPMLEQASERLAGMRGRFLALADEDAAAYADLNAIQRLAADDPDRLAREPDALRRAIQAPEHARVLAMDLLELIESLVGRTNKWLASDLAIAGVAGEAAAVAAGWNVRVNAPGLPDGAGDAYLERVDAGETEAAAIRSRIEAACRGG
jgi:formiminotetrahydrofolate cyclodeaminase